MIKKSVLILCIPLFFLFCSHDQATNPYATPVNIGSEFAIYFLQEGDVKIYDALNMVPTYFGLQNTPWLSGNDIEMYDWSSHCVYLKKDKSAFFEGYGTEETKDTGLVTAWYYKPFVVTAQQQLCYMGYFYPITYADMWYVPDISFGGINYYPDDIINIEYPWLYSEDIRNIDQIKQALIDSSLYHGGISAELDTLNGVNFIDVGDTSTIEYSIILTNNDQDNLLILDPDLAGSEIFHWYNPGLILLDPDYNIYRADYKTTAEPLPGVNYYTELKSGESIRRSITLRGYGNIPDGTYYLQLSYFSGNMQRPKSERMVGDSRYWIGPTRTGVYGCVKGDSLSKASLQKSVNPAIYRAFRETEM